MRAHNPKAKSKSGGIGRARMIVKSKLWWLVGFPDDGKWVTVPASGQRGSELVDLDRNHLRRGTYALTKLRVEFPRALPELVGDSKAWLAATTSLFSLLKPWVHKHLDPAESCFTAEFYPESVLATVKRIRKTHPSLIPVLGPLSWLLLTCADQADAYLRWLNREHAAVETVLGCLPRREALTAIFQAAHVGSSLSVNAFAPLAREMCNLKVHRTSLRGFLEGLKRVNRAQGQHAEPLALTAPESEFPMELRRWLAWLIGQDRKTRGRFLELLGPCDTRAIAEKADAWWSELTAISQRAYNIRRGYEKDELKKKRLKSVPKALEGLRETQPVTIALKRVTAALCFWSDAEQAAAFRSLRKVLSILLQGSEEPPPELTIGCLVYWHRVVCKVEIRKHFEIYLKYFVRYLAETSDERALAPWSHQFPQALEKKNFYPELDDDFLECDFTRKGIETFFSALSRVHRSHPSVDLRKAVGILDNLVRVTKEDERSVALLMALHERNPELSDWHCEQDLRVAEWIVGDEYHEYRNLVDACEQINQQSNGSPEVIIKGLLPVFHDDLDLLRTAILGRHRKRLIRAGQKISTLGSLKSRSFRFATRCVAPTWIDDLPEALRAPIRTLCELGPKGVASAERLLTSAARDAIALDREREAIRAQLASADERRKSHLQIRLANLENREPGIEQLTAAQLKKLVAKIRNQTVGLILELADAEATEQLHVAAAELLGDISVPDWLLEPENMHVFACVPKLGKAHQNLAFQLYRVRSGPKPWDLRDHPANRRFLDELSASGIRCEPWVDGIGMVSTKTRGGTVHLALEEDCLEIFRMGGYFKTCLSPGDMNFFSVLANAADINKRVLYARNDAGNVVGRRLLCLTQGGSILAFHAYCDREAIDFEAVSSDFTLELASRMGTKVVPTGNVPTLIATDWYDDMAVIIHDGTSILNDGSNFRKKLKELPLEEVPSLLENTIEYPMNTDLAECILRLNEVNARPELARIILDHMRSPRELLDPAAVNAALLLSRSGSASLACALFEGAITRQVVRLWRMHQCFDATGLAVLAEEKPSAALRLIKTAREKMRSWTKDQNQDRLMVMALATENLHRPKQAAKIYRHVLSLPYRGNRDEIRQKIATLEAS